MADREHELDPRYYAHTFHRSGVICVARAFDSLPLSHYWAILAHEVGHLLAGPEGDEEDADALASEYFGITIKYSTTEHGEDLQTVSLKDAKTISQHSFVLY
jgi:hypothetical protein